MPCTIVVGGFFGDEGKGKVISYLASKDGLNLTVRGGVGTNAGHTIVQGGKTFKMRMLPSAFVNPRTRLLIGPGVLVNPEIFLKEVELTSTDGRVGLDPQCAIIEERHIEEDRGSKHLKEGIGTTGTGCGPCNVDRVNRVARIAREIQTLRKYLKDVPIETNESIEKGERVLLEGTQGTFISLFHGTYPYVTSKDVTASSIAADVGVGPTRVTDVVVVFKAYVTRVGTGPLSGELPEEEARERGWAEVATVTGRSRRVAPFNYEMARRAVMLNGATELALTKMDVVFPECRGKKRFEGLPRDVVRFVERVENETKVSVTLIGTGPSVEDMIDRRPKP